MDQPDKLTQTRGSIEAKMTLADRLSRIFCPCITFKCQQQRNANDYFQSNMQNTSMRTSVNGPMKTLELQMKYPLQNYSQNQSFLQKDLLMNQSAIFGIEKFQNTSIREFRNSLSIQRELTHLNKFIDLEHSKKRQNQNLPIFKYKEDQLLLVGKNKKNIFIKISTVKLQPTVLAVQKQFSSKQNDKSKKHQDKCKILDQFWGVRYYYFQKFDEGIQIDQQSLKYLTPEIVSDYITGKCHDCKIALDAFSGVGHNATKLGTVCQKVICVQQNNLKSNYLINNAKCYEIYNIQLFMRPFLQINPKTKIDVVLLHPNVYSQMYLQTSSCQLKHFKPNLCQVIQKSLQISNNIVFLLPKNISIKDLCYQISKQAQNSSKIFNTCSLKVEKIYFKSHLLYIAVFFGPSVQDQITIHDQLDFIYKFLKDPQQKSFYYKKLIRYIRQKYGMIKLINFISGSQIKDSNGKSSFQAFTDYIKQKQLIPQNKLKNLLDQQKRIPIKQINKSTSSEFESSYTTNQTNKRFRNNTVQEEYKISQNSDQQQHTVTQRTQSFYSSVSGFSGLNKKNTSKMNQSLKIQNSQKSDTFQKNSNTSSINIKKITQDSLEKDSKSPASPLTISKNLIPQRHTINHKQIENALKQTQRQRLKRTVIQRPQQN